jgi:hypothetical protein
MHPEDDTTLYGNVWRLNCRRGGQDEEQVGHMQHHALQ